MLRSTQFTAVFLLLILIAGFNAANGQQLTTMGKPAQLDIRQAGENSIRITLKPLSFSEDFPYTPALAEGRQYPAAAISLREAVRSTKKKVGNLTVEVRPDPLTLIVTNSKGQAVQRIVFEEDGNLSFGLYGKPVLGMGEGGPLPERGVNWRELPIQFDRRGNLDKMEPRWQADAYGSRNPVATLVGTDGWGIFISSPWVQVDLRDAQKGTFIPYQPPADAGPQTQRNQGQNLGKGLPPADKIVPGLFDFFVFDTHDPLKFMKDYSVITGKAAMPPKWALGYMQSHRTLEDESQMIGIIDSFRVKKIPVDAVIYLGTGFTPVGWNTRQPSFDFNPVVFKRDPKLVLADMHARNVKVVMHMVPWDRDKLPTLRGSIPAKPGETVDASHIEDYWKQHIALVNTGVDAFWPDEGDWFNLFERINRHQLYYQGHLSLNPNVRPWALHRNGYPGIAQWGGWVWSGDTESAWKTLEGQVAVGLNYSLSIGPYWGSDIGGFTPNAELTGELYARWFQFGAFNASFRSHGRTWWTRLPWGWGLSKMGPIEGGNRNPLESELNNKSIEPVIKKFDELHYQLMPYEYTLAWEARELGLPLMRAMWLHYPDDPNLSAMATQYLWGRDMLIAPVFEKGARTREVYLPSGDWYDWWTNEKQSGGKRVSKSVDLSIMPIYVRAGAIIPVDPVRQYTAEVITEPTTLKVYSGSDGQFTLYDDDGISQDYLKSIGSWTNLKWDEQKRTLTIAPGAPKGAKNVLTPKVFRVQLLPEGSVKTVNYSGRATSIRF